MKPRELVSEALAAVAVCSYVVAVVIIIVTALRC